SGQRITILSRPPIREHRIIWNINSIKLFSPDGARVQGRLHPGEQLNRTSGAAAGRTGEVVGGFPISIHLTIQDGRMTSSDLNRERSGERSINPVDGTRCHRDWPDGRVLHAPLYIMTVPLHLVRQLP